MSLYSITILSTARGSESKLTLQGPIFQDSWMTQWTPSKRVCSYLLIDYHLDCNIYEREKFNMIIMIELSNSLKFPDPFTVHHEIFK